MKFKEGKLKEWTQKLTEPTMKYYFLSENYIAYKILPPPTTMTQEPIGAPWAGTTKVLVPMHSKVLKKPMPTL